MKCFRCGYCCTNLLVIIPTEVDGDEDTVFLGTNWKVIGDNEENMRCPHLRGDKVGEYSCSIHNKSWFQRIPCSDYQEHVEKCRLGEYRSNKERG